ncbi:aldose epimerase family protein [Variovorax sp. OV329]|uniref:aldose epimerase family protein n=1 Tax=Variovorax sp. OV329 TaxID=1882825 RepID=UPI0008E2C810|nr:aldose epimerase family protein [Variovorax sp. OV329]SFM16364.1 aldose 1-epimerase [Variovorax sp. OV329]
MSQALPAGIEQRAWGELSDGRAVREFTLRAASGLVLRAINYGGIVSALEVPDREGQLASVVLGLPKLRDYEARNPHMGTIVGRHANRIGGARFALDGREVKLEPNEGANILHGGARGFGKVWWDIEPLPLAGDGSAAIALRYTSADGEGGFPGTMDVQVRYTLGPGFEWRIDYEARSDKTTVVNLSHHDYFNLRGHGDVMDHRLLIPASRYCPIDAERIPTGLAPVEGTPFDFREGPRIGERIREPHEQIQRGKGYDHNFAIDSAQAPGDGMRFIARLADPSSGRAMDIQSTEPGLQFYSGNYLDGSLEGSGGSLIRQGDGLCLETQHFPDAPNHPEFASTRLAAGELFKSSTVMRFSTFGAGDDPFASLSEDHRA